MPHTTSRQAPGRCTLSLCPSSRDRFAVLGGGRGLGSSARARREREAELRLLIHSIQSQTWFHFIDAERIATVSDVSLNPGESLYDEVLAAIVQQADPWGQPGQVGTFVWMLYESCDLGDPSATVFFDVLRKVFSDRVPPSWVTSSLMHLLLVTRLTPESETNIRRLAEALSGALRGAVQEIKQLNAGPRDAELDARARSCIIELGDACGWYRKALTEDHSRDLLLEPLIAVLEEVRGGRDTLRDWSFAEGERPLAQLLDRWEQLYGSVEAQA